MDLKKEWMSKVKNILNSPLVATVGFGFIQMILEKLIELEFACPCRAGHNRECTLPFFIVPSLIVFFLMCAIKYPIKPCQWKAFWEAQSSTIVPALTWVVIVFIDGRYWACLNTNWSGRYEMIENAAPQKWCKPANSSQDLLASTQLWYSKSQCIGLWTALGLALFYLTCYALSRWTSSSEENRESSRNEANEEGAESL